jgi:catechol 2,3-dioxygenase-like lactoylglutathione lyase family enzyme
MGLKNFLIVIKDVEASKRFYHQVFGLDVVLNQEGNVIMTQGLVLQEEKVWSDFLGKEVIHPNHASLLYFEEQDMDAFIEKLEGLYPDVVYVNRLSDGMVRFYDPDGNLIEVRER